MHSGLRERRVKAGLAQRELAERIGVSRQTLTALEAGESVPATSLALQLARVLGCRVEDIFWLEEEPAPLQAVVVGPERAADRPGPEEADPTRGKSGTARRPARAPPAPQPLRVAVAVVGERWVAHPLDDQTASGCLVAADGLLNRPRAAAGKPSSIQPLRETALLRQNLFGAGCDPAMGLLAAHIDERWRGGRLHWLPTGSGRALDMFARGEVHLAGVHLFDEESGQYNVAAAQRRLGGRALVLVNLATWEQGLVVAAGNPRKIRGVRDLGARGVRVVGREAGSGASELLSRLRAEAGLPGKAIEQVGVADGHLAVAQRVAVGAADAGIATRAAATAWGLEFLALDEARFDLVIPAGGAQDPRLERMLDVLRSARFRRDLGGLAGYGTSRTGQLIAEMRRHDRVGRERERTRADPLAAGVVRPRDLPAGGGAGGAAGAADLRAVRHHHARPAPGRLSLTRWPFPRCCSASPPPPAAWRWSSLLGTPLAWWLRGPRPAGSGAARASCARSRRWSPCRW